MAFILSLAAFLKRHFPDGNHRPKSVPLVALADDAVAAMGAGGAPTTTAANDFQVGNGSGSWIKKTLAEIKTILGLGTAAYTASTDYAVAAKGVTNGDAHDHVGGDGGTIAYSSLSGTPTIPTVSDVAYDATTWNGNTDAPTKNAVRDKIETLGGGHTQNTDTNLGALGAKNPPIDADKVIFRDSVAADGLVTSTWTQIKAFLKTYFDGVYAAALGADDNYVTDTEKANLHAPGSDNQVIPDELADLTADSTHRTVTDAEKSTWNAKQAALGFTPENVANKAAASGYASLDAGTKIPIAQIPTGATSVTVPLGNDSRFTDARTPTAHAATHTNGADDIQNATASQKGLATSTQIAKLDGIAASANNYVHPNHSGDVTSVADGTQTIATGVVTNAKLANVAADTIKGRKDVGTGVPEDLTPANVRSMINVSEGADVTATAIAPAIHVATSKATPVDADELGIVDSAASNVLKRLTWANLKATLKTYFDGIYAAIGANPFNQSLNTSDSVDFVNVTVGGTPVLGVSRCVYTAILNQGSTSAPVATGEKIADANTGAWSYDITGKYKYTFDNAIAANVAEIKVQLTNAYVGRDAGVYAYASSTTEILIGSYDGAGSNSFNDDRLVNASIQVWVDNP